MKITNNQYILSGAVNPLDLCKKYESPLFVYDSAIMIRQYERLKSAFQVKNLKINYACKALSNVNILKLFHSLGTGLDTVSFQEIRLALAAGFAPKDIIYTPNGVSIEEIAQAVGEGVRITIDNISILEQFGHQFPNYPVAVRINPHVMAGGNIKISTGHIDSKFGISIHQLPHVVRVVKATGLTVEGVHMHTGSDILNIDDFLEGVEILLEAAIHFDDLKFIDFGSGFKVAYKPNDKETDIEKLGKKITKRFNAFCKEYGRELTLMFEPGKFLVSEAGYFFVKVNVVKQTTSMLIAGVDSGLNHLKRPMFYDAYHHIINVSKPTGKTRLYTIVGYICETDTFAMNRKITKISEDDILCFYNAGAYCYQMASNYNSRYRPAEVLVHEGKDYLIRKRETIEDILRNQVELALFAP